MTQPGYMTELQRQAPVYMRPTKDQLHKAAIELVKIETQPIETLRDALLSIVWITHRKTYRFRLIENDLRVKFGDRFSDIDTRLGPILISLFRDDNILYTTGGYLGAGGQFAIHDTVIGVTKTYLKNYKERHNLVPKTSDVFSTDFPSSFWEKKYPRDLVKDPQTDLYEYVTRYDPEDLKSWGVKDKESDQQESLKPYPNPTGKEETQPSAKVINLPMSNWESPFIEKKKEDLPEVKKIPVDPELGQVGLTTISQDVSQETSEEQKKKNKRRQMEHDFVITIFNSDRYYDGSLEQCLANQVWHNAKFGPKGIIDKVVLETKVDRQVAIDLYDRWISDQLLTMAISGHHEIKPSIRAEVIALKKSPVGINGARLISKA